LPLKELIQAEHEVLAVVTQPDRYSGRGRHITSCSVKQEAQRHGLKIFQPQKVRDTAFIEDLQSLKPSLIIVAAYGQILPREIIRLPDLGCVNIHASLLPQYRGAAPINWTIINGESTTGITIMLMDEGMDTGPVLLQEKVRIHAEDTAESLSQRLSKVGASVLRQALRDLKEGILKPLPQAGDVSYAPLLKKSDGLIQWSMPAKKICDFIRGMNPWPAAFHFLEGQRIKILKAVIVEGKGAPGFVLKATKHELLVGTGEQILSVIDVQPPGKPIMSVTAFLQGRKIKQGTCFMKV
jgi:methionyl-tRNA formyltransferase